MGDVTVITASLPERGRMLERARRSVEAQTDPPAGHLIGVDYAGHGPARIRNQLASIAETEWLAFLDDDDHLDLDHLETLLRCSDADVVYPDCRFDGPPLPDKHLPGPYNRERLRSHGFIPITFLVRTSMFERVDGFDLSARYEDWECLNAMADKGARFAFVPRATWTYCTAHPERRTNL